MPIRMKIQKVGGVKNQRNNIWDKKKLVDKKKLRTFATAFNGNTIRAEHSKSPLKD